MDRQAGWIVVYELRVGLFPLIPALIPATPCPDCVRGYRARNRHPRTVLRRHDPRPRHQHRLSLPAHHRTGRRTGLARSYVTTRCELGEWTGDSKRRSLLVRELPDSLQHNEIHPMSDWGSSGRRFKSCQPDTGQRVFLAPESASEVALAQND